jgi:hypothetical protein
MLREVHARSTEKDESDLKKTVEFRLKSLGAPRHANALLTDSFLRLSPGPCRSLLPPGSARTIGASLMRSRTASPESFGIELVTKSRACCPAR